jgi:hypothetical protein
LGNVLEITMNERINELAKQAGWGKGEAYDDCMQCSPFDPEKFAELIVRECIQAVKNVGGYNEDYHMNAIKKYFGVEE